jgi:ATP-dependent 26S proteasome regulatory subunit
VQELQVDTLHSGIYLEGNEANWIVKAAHKRRSQFSTVVLFETSDPERIKDFEKLLFEQGYIDVFNMKKGGSVLPLTRLIYDPWEGLKQIERREDTIVTTPLELNMDSEGDRARALLLGGGDGIFDLTTALRTAEGLMKTKPTVFIIKNIANKEQPLLQALRSWTDDGQILSQKSTVFIFAESASLILDDYTKKLTAIVPIPISTDEEREKIIRDLSSKMPNVQFQPHLIKVSAGLNLHDTEASLLESYFAERSFSVNQLTEFKTEMVKKTGILTFERAKFGFEAIGGYEETKRFIKDEIIALLENPDKVASMGLELPRGILLFGPAGTGKTIIAQAIAYQLQLPFINFRLEDVLRGIVGESEQRLRTAIDLIEEISPSVVFIDEIDRLGQRSDVSTDSGVSRRIFSMLLEWLGKRDRKAILIATTNTPEQLDDAMMRPGRLDVKFPILYPDADARRDILRIHLDVVRKVPHDEIDYEKIVDKTRLWTGAELEDLVKRATRTAFIAGATRVGMPHILEALRSFNVGKNRDEELKKQLKLANRFCDNLDFLKKVSEESTDIYSKADALLDEVTTK